MKIRTMMKTVTCSMKNLKREAQERSGWSSGREEPAAVGARLDREWGLSADDAVARMLVRREAGADRHGRAADRHTATILQKLKVGIERQSAECLFRVGETVAQGVEFESHVVSPYAVLLGHHCPTLTLARGNSECNHQLSQYVWALPLARSSSSASLSTSLSSSISHPYPRRKKIKMAIEKK